jgi:membrane protein DedA with SNARE-associated domain
MNVNHLVGTYGYWVVFLLVMAESLGVPLPGETALIAAGTYAGASHRLNPWLVFLVAGAAALLGDNIGYLIGRVGGYRLAVRYGPKVHLRERELKVARYVFDRWGVLVVFLGRFVSVLRTYAAFLAGTSRMRWRMFLPANAAGGLIWAAAYTAASYFAGKAVERASGTVTLVLGLVAAAVVVTGIFLLRRSVSKLAERAEQAYPGPLDGSSSTSGPALVPLEPGTGLVEPGTGLVERRAERGQ